MSILKYIQTRIDESYSLNKNYQEAYKQLSNLWDILEKHLPEEQKELIDKVESTYCELIIAHEQELYFTGLKDGLELKDILFPRMERKERKDTYTLPELDTNQMFALVDAFQRAEREFNTSGDDQDNFKELRTYIARNSKKQDGVKEL